MWRKLIYTLILILSIPVILVALPLMLVWAAIEGLLLRLWFCFSHKRFGRDVILITSDSPLWNEYIKDNILSKLADRALVMNWSERRLWRRRHHFARQFIWRFPIAVQPAMIL